MTKKNPLKFALKNKPATSPYTSIVELQNRVVAFEEKIDALWERQNKGAMEATKRLDDLSGRLNTALLLQQGDAQAMEKVEANLKALGQEMTTAQSDIVKLKGWQSGPAPRNDPTLLDEATKLAANRLTALVASNKINTERAREIHELKRKLAVADEENLRLRNGRAEEMISSGKTIAELEARIEFEMAEHKVAEKALRQSAEESATAEKKLRAELVAKGTDERVDFWRRTATGYLDEIIRLRGLAK